MSALCLSIPLHGERVPVSLTSSTTEIIFLFNLDEALFEKIEDTLQVYFAHNASTLVLENFYKIFDSNSYPTFILDNIQVKANDILDRKIGTYIEYGKSYFEVDELPAPDEMLISQIDYTHIINKHELDLSAFSDTCYFKTSRAGNDAIIKVCENENACHEITLKNLGEFASSIEKELQNQYFKGILRI